MRIVDEIKATEVAEKLKGTASPTDAEAVLKMIRKEFVCTMNTYDDIMKKCLHTGDDIVSIEDPKYPIFNEDVREVLDTAGDREGGILLLTKMIMVF